MLDIRPSPIAGTWYPASPAELAAEVDEYIANAERNLPPLDGEVLGIVSPHAGIRYSGPVAGYSYAAVKGKSPELVVIISPMHYPYPSPMLTTAHSAYATPLGAIPVDRSALARLSALLEAEIGISPTPVANDPEHSLEIELPFLQRALAGEFKLLPIMLRDYRPQVCQALGLALAEICPRDTLFVASSDLSHYYPQAVAERYDREMLRRIASLDPIAVLRAEAEGVGFACGAGPIAATIWAVKARGARRGVILHHATSGDTTGDYSSVVGYGAVAFLR